MTEFRENLKPFLNKRVKVRGTFAKWEDDWIRNYKKVSRVCIANPEIDGELVSQHVWVVDVPHWKQYRDSIGSQVIFDAVVQQYRTRSNETNYCFGNASDLIFLHLAGIAIPDPPQEEDLTEEEPAPAPAPAPELQLNPIDKLRQIGAWAKTCGGYDLVEKVLENMPSMPVPELLEYIRALKELDSGENNN